MSDLIYFKRNVNYSVGIRADLMDRKGAVLHGGNPFYAVKKENLRDFKFANERLIKKGLIIETTEPSVEWEITNAISDEQAAALVKNYVALKNELQRVDSISTVEKLLSEAEKQDRPVKTMKIIEARLAELREDVNEEWAPPALDKRKPADVRG